METFANLILAGGVLGGWIFLIFVLTHGLRAASAAAKKQKEDK